jgi:hypothetical protein
LLGAETNGLAFSASDDSMEIRDTVTPANNYVGSPITKFGAVRASAGLYYDVNGILQSSASGLRRDYDPRISGPKYLIEEQRTNLLLPSIPVTGPWGVSSMTITANSAVAPDGTTTASLLTATGTSGVQVYCGVTMTAAAHTWSCYFKKGTGAFGVISAYDSVGNHNSWFNITTGVAGSNEAGNTSTITALANGWFLCTVTRTAAVGSGYGVAGISNADNNLAVTNGVTMYAWGYGVEAGAFASSYIPTTSAAVTRAKDTPQIASTAFNLSQTAGTLYLNYNMAGYVGLWVWLVSLTSGSGEAETIYFRQQEGTLQSGVTDNSVEQAPFSFSNGVAVGTATKYALAYAANDFAGCMNGGTVSTDVSGTLPTTTTLNVGGVYKFNSFDTLPGGWIKELRHLPRRQTNVEIQTVTTP